MLSVIMLSVVVEPYRQNYKQHSVSLGILIKLLVLDKRSSLCRSITKTKGVVTLKTDKARRASDHELRERLPGNPEK
jgi:hypothetical protein